MVGVLGIFTMLAVLGFILWYTGVFGLYARPASEIAVGGGIAPGQGIIPAGTTKYTGPVTPVMAHQNALAYGTTLREASHVRTFWWRCIGMIGISQNCATGWSQLASGNGSWQSTPDMNGMIYMESEGNLGSTHYLGIKETKAVNPSFIVQYAYVDFDNDANKEHMFLVNYGGIKSETPGQTDAKLPMSIQWYNYQAPTGRVMEPASAAPPTSIGTAANNTQVYRFRFTFANFDRAFLVNKIEVKLNNTDVTKWTIDNVEVQFQNTLFAFNGISADQIVNDGTNNTYTKFFAKDRSGAEQNWFFVTRTGGVLYVDAVIHITWRLTTGNSVILDLRIYGWTDDETIVRAIAQVINHETASGTAG